MLIKDCVEDRMGYRTIFNKFAKDRKNGKKDWSIGGVKKVANKIKRGVTERKKGTGPKRTVLTTTVVESVKNFIEKNPSSRTSSISKIRQGFGLSHGSAVRCVQKIGLKSLQKEKGTELSGKNIKERL